MKSFIKMAWKPYRPAYSFFETVERYGSMLRAIGRAVKVSLVSNFFPKAEQKYAASYEITDRCNAGCPHCYVYDPSWDQRKRMGGYLGLDPKRHREREKQVLENLKELRQRGIIHLTLVGGETGLAPEAIRLAGKLFPVVWLVTNGTMRLPSPLPRSVVVFVSIDGLPGHHNRVRDPLGFFKRNRYGKLEGMMAAMVRNINESERGAYVHTTLTRQTLKDFEEFVYWLVREVKKLRGIVVSGVTTKDPKDTLALRPEDRRRLKAMIERAAKKYSWSLFPLNSPRVNDFLFDEKNIIKGPKDCLVARRVESLGFGGKSVGKCIFRDEASCETCVCNITGIFRAFTRLDGKTVGGLIATSMG